MPLVAHQWAEYNVKFPQFQRKLNSGYLCLTSEKLKQQTQTLVQENPDQLQAQFNQEVLIQDCCTISWAGQIRKFDLVVDARGWPELTGPLGYQKFLGLEVELDEPHGLEAPLLMDATQTQVDGFRFFYVLPFSKTRLLIEETYYSNSSSLDEAHLKENISTYASSQSWKIKSVLRKERGQLPLALTKQPDPISTLSLGAAARFYQPVTGYSTPQILQSLEWLLSQELRQPAILEKYQDWLKAKAAQFSYYFLLNRMLFLAGPAQKRYQVLQRFYGLSQPLIGRFYSGHSTAWDKVRILAGKPPVPIWGALKTLFVN